LKKRTLLFITCVLISLSIVAQNPTYFRWAGGAMSSDYDQHSWNFADNWEIWIPEDDDYYDPELYEGEWVNAWIAPGEEDNCIIPDGRSYYPKYPAYPNWENKAECYNLKIKPGGEINWQNPDGNNNIILEVAGDFEIQDENENPGMLNIGDNATVEVGKEEPVTGNLNIEGAASLTHVSATLNVTKDLNIFHPNGLTILGAVTVNGDTDVSEDMGLVIKADETGMGSFINNGDINFDTYAGAKVETYISGSVGYYYMHFTGPTVLDSSSLYRSGNISGVRLQQFNVTNLETYNYEWNSLADTTDHESYPWMNVLPADYNVPSGNGLAVSNSQSGSGHMEMSGTLISEDVIYNVRSFVNNNLELVSNPFSAAIDFEDLYNYGNNSDVIKGHYWIYDASTGNYYGGADGANSGMIQIGQGFFVEVNGNGGDLIFSPSIRSHSEHTFRETHMNILQIDVSGGEGGYTDELTIRFDENATNGYDENIEVKKWNSFGYDATMIRSITEDGTELSVNALPVENLNNPMTSIPIHFECGYDAEYTFNFSGIETFEYAISIWIEDLFTGDWISIPESNPSFTFTGSPNDGVERFILHFMGPTAINEFNRFEETKPVHIYSSNNKVYVRNKSEQRVKEIAVYNLPGQEIYRNAVPKQSLYQISLNENIGYYVVRVRTDQSIYSEKIFINKH